MPSKTVTVSMWVLEDSVSDEMCHGCSTWAIYRLAYAVGVGEKLSVVSRSGCAVCERRQRV